uniref:SMB domain-containing protein n=1 Tax=Gongylonema pulchrum TaxID=637853 RepID=A0A183CZ58_9BILA
LPCKGDEDCGVFDVCVLDICIANHQECRLDNHEDCEVFEYCFDGECVPDHQDCPNGTCPEDQVCVNKKCEVHPDTTQAPPKITQVTIAAQPCKVGWIHKPSQKSCYMVLHLLLCRAAGSHLC